MNPHNAGFLMALVSALLFSSKGIVVKLAYELQIEAIGLLALRLLFAAPLYIVTLLWSERQKAPKDRVHKKLSSLDWGELVVLGFIGYYLSSALDFIGLQYLSVGLERMVLFLYPTFVVILSWIFLKRTPARNIWIALTLSYGGVVMAYFGDLDFNRDKGPYGVAMVLGAAMCFAVYMIRSKRMIEKIGANSFTAIAFLLAGFFMNVHYGVFLQGSYWGFSKDLYPIVILLVLACTFVPSLMMMHAVRLLGAERVAVVAGMGPVMTVVLGVLVLNESIHLLEACGVAVVIAGGFFLKVKPHKSQTSEDAEPKPVLETK